MQEVQELTDRASRLEKVMTDIVKIPLASDPSDELSRKFSDILHEHGVGDMESIVVGATCLNMLSKMGASLEKVKMSLSEGTSKITKLQMKLGAWREREKSKAGRAKRVALERLDPEASAEKHASVKQRRRMNWHRKKATGKAKKRIEEDFDNLVPTKVYRPRPTIAQKLEVVQWYKEMLEKRCTEDTDEDSEPKDPQQESDHESRKRIRKKQRRRTTKKKKAMVSPSSAGHARHGAKRGMNMHIVAQQKFPAVVGPHVNLMRWVKSAKAQRWEDLPEQAQQNHREVPDDWRRAFDLSSKGKIRLKHVPGEVLQALDKHMVLVCQGVSPVTERNEEVLLHEIVGGLVVLLSSNCGFLSKIIAAFKNPKHKRCICTWRKCFCAVQE